MSGSDVDLIAPPGRSGVPRFEDGWGSGQGVEPDLSYVRDLPLGEASVDAVVSATLLEHVPDDRRVLTELRRVLRPGAPAVVVVPAGPGLYDYYDRFLGHRRRYGRGELAARARSVGLQV